jgi:hypothetical protein
MVINHPPESAVVSTTSALIIPTNKMRVGLHLHNIGHTTLSLGFDNPAVNDKGIVLPAGASYILAIPDITEAGIYGISSSPSGNLAWQEFSKLPA